MHSSLGAVLRGEASDDGAGDDDPDDDPPAEKRARPPYVVRPFTFSWNWGNPEDIMINLPRRGVVGGGVEKI